MPNNFI